MQITIDFEVSENQISTGPYLTVSDYIHTLAQGA
jgi:hypothetical protein